MYLPRSSISLVQVLARGNYWREQGNWGSFTGYPKIPLTPGPQIHDPSRYIFGLPASRPLIACFPDLFLLCTCILLPLPIPRHLIRLVPLSSEPTSTSRISHHIPQLTLSHLSSPQIPTDNPVSGCQRRFFQCRTPGSAHPPNSMGPTKTQAAIPVRFHRHRHRDGAN